MKHPWAIQRLSLFFRGIEVPALGSPRDKTFRAFLMHEARVEVKKHEMAYLMALTSPEMRDVEFARTWAKQVRNTFNGYVSLLQGEEPEELTEEEGLMLDYYEKVIKKTRVEVTKKEDGKLVATGILGKL